MNRGNDQSIDNMSSLPPLINEGFTFIQQVT